MHALVGVFQMDLAKAAEQQAVLEERIIPMVKHQPGFVSGFWSTDPATGRSHSFIVFQTEAQAHGLAELVRGNARQQNTSGVAVDSLTIVAVVGSA